MTQTLNSQKGFTLIELMVAIAIFGVVIAGVIGAFRNQLVSNNTQQLNMQMQQNARAAMYYMTRELKLAGLDPTGDANAGVVTANRNRLQFTMDFTGGSCVDEIAQGLVPDDDDGDGIPNEGCNGGDENGNLINDEPDEAEWFDGDTGDANENITYWLRNGDGNGVCPVGAVCDLMRRMVTAAGVTDAVLAPNVDALNFNYLGRNPGAGGCPVGAINCPLTPAQAQANPQNIRSVQVTIVARAGADVPAFAYRHLDTRTYFNNAAPNPNVILAPRNDRFRRLYLTNEIRCRNLGIQ
jgi:type IV pilus assembly protein PilW